MNEPRFHIIIPARYASSRLPGKPLRDLAGKPMIVRVLERAQASGALRTVVATDDGRILDAVQAAGGESIMTREDHPSGSDRLAEAADILKLKDDEIVVNLQGDEPLMPAAAIQQVAIRAAADDGVPVNTLAVPIEERRSLFDPNVVKVVLDADGHALYFSRAPIPWHRLAFDEPSDEILPGADYLRHVGLYAYRVGFLKRLCERLPAAAEKAEQLEQLRVLDMGARIGVECFDGEIPAGVDTEDDLKQAALRFESQSQDSR